MSRPHPPAPGVRPPGETRVGAWLGWGAIAGALALTLLASSPWWPNVSGAIEFIPGKDKTGHFLIMGALAGACVLAFTGQTWRGRRISAGLLLALVALAVTVDELVQAAVPSRTFDLGDLAASLAGVSVFGGLAALMHRRRQSGVGDERAPEAEATGHDQHHIRLL